MSTGITLQSVKQPAKECNLTNLVYVHPADFRQLQQSGGAGSQGGSGNSVGGPKVYVSINGFPFLCA